VVPKFEKIFGEFGVTLPVPTQMLLTMGNWISEQYGFLYIIASPIAVLFLVKLIRMSPAGRMALDKTILMVPVVGGIVGKTAVARFTRTLGTLISAGVPILDALNITKDTSGNEVYRRALGGVHESIRKGESFAEPLRKARVVDGLVVNMVDVGEETGDLDKMLEKVADNYDEQVDRLVTSLVSLLEPVLVISLGVTCGFIVIALFMPMIKMIETLSG
ncbi:MAG: type II secretion system F family protein, partial [Planctomycetes bacterium]|nr:type II secretion system F family protein [Planctomycetota bacterium]